MIIIIAGIYAITVIIYFLSLRDLIQKDAFEKIDTFFVISVMIIGFVPTLNMIVSIFFHVGHMIFSNDLSSEDIIKKILFIKDKGDYNESN